MRTRPGRAYLAGAPVFVAHRGGSGLAPENTLAAFRSAVEDWGVDMLELDVRLTADGEVVVIHDETVDRTTDGTGRVADHTLAQLKELDAGYRFLDPDGEASFRGRGVTIPTMEELLDACPNVWLNVEAKEAQVAGPLVELIRRRGETHRVLVAAEHEENRRDALGYEGPWGASRRHCIAFWLCHHLPWGGPYTPPVDALQIPELWKGVRVLTPRLVREAHRRNIPVHVWTVDDPQDMRRLLEWGVDAIQTDRPDLLSEVLVEVAGRPLPPCRR
ncbi:MAG: glycerophosphodiester phosphodiesterase [Longimicrobiales bacterium]|nr:glycerophosphodiester phosphodiesterase [Longimicrobiales bacterium]